MSDRTSSDDGSPGWAAATVTSAGIVGVAGTLAGLVWGGVGGRIAMRILFLTSDDSVRGMTSDAGFEIGTISLGTAFLVVFAAIAGAIIGMFGGLLRMVTAGPTWLVGLGAGLASAAFFGALLVTPEGVDFNVLDPLWLGVTLFVVLPGLWAASTVVVGEWLARPGRLFATLPQRIDERRFGFAGWIVLAVLTAAGVVSLVIDIRDLA